MRILTVRVIPGSRRELITQHSADAFTIQVSPPALKGKANKAMLRALARHLNLRENQLMVTKGEATNLKTILVLEE